MSIHQCTPLSNAIDDHVLLKKKRDIRAPKLAGLKINVQLPRNQAGSRTFSIQIVVLYLPISAHNSSERPNAFWLQLQGESAAGCRTGFSPAGVQRKSGSGPVETRRGARMEGSQLRLRRAGAGVL